MLLSASSLISKNILSLRLGGPIAVITDDVIDPSTLSIIAFIVDGPDITTRGPVLDVRSIRGITPRGLVIDSIDELVDESDVIKIKQTLDLDFHLDGLRVETRKGKSLGTITDYTIDLETMTIMQLVVKRPFMKSFLDPELTISRQNIVEVNDKKIIVKDDTEKSPKTSETFTPNYINPFRKTALET